MKFIVLANKWDDMTPKEKAQYLKDHPNSKYAKRKRKRKNDASPTKQGSVPPAEDSNTQAKKGTGLITAPKSGTGTKPPRNESAEDEKDVKPVEVSPEDYLAAMELVEEEFTKPEAKAALAAIAKAKALYGLGKDKASLLKVEEAQLLSAALSMLAAMAVIAIIPESASAVTMLATHAGAALYAAIGESGKHKKDDDEKGKSAESAPDAEPQFEYRADEAANAELRRNQYATRNLDAAGYFNEERVAEAVTDQFVKQRGKGLVQ